MNIDAPRRRARGMIVGCCRPNNGWPFLEAFRRRMRDQLDDLDDGSKSRKSRAHPPEAIHLVELGLKAKPN
jgi:hypothetical protein